MTLEEWDQEKDRELDEQLTALFREADAPLPPAGFVSRAMKAVKRAPLPVGRQPLRGSWEAPAAWVTVVAAAAAVCYAALENQRLVAALLSFTVSFGARAGMRLVQSVHTSSMVFELLATMSRVVSHAMFTREAAGALTLMAATAAISLSMLNRLLSSEKESSSW